MKEIETLAIQTYEKNLAFLKEKYQETFTKIQALNSATQSGQYSEKYSLEYMTTYFDVKLNNTNDYLYADNSIEISKQLSKQVNFRKDSYHFDGFRMHHNIEKIEDELQDTQKGLLGLYPLMSYYLDNHKESDQLKTIKKFIFIGTGLALHLPLIDSIVKAKHYLIIEDDLELFHLSLFCTPYYNFAKETNLTFCIAQNNNIFANTFEQFLEEAWFTNKYLKYSYFPAHSNEKIKHIQNRLASQNFMTFPYRTAIDKHLKPLEFINNDYTIVNLSEHLHETIFSQKPTLVIGAGPSLDKQTSWLRENHSKFIIIAVASTLKYLYENSVTPDLVIHVDGFDNSINLFNSFDSVEFLKDSLLLFGSFVPTNVRELFKKEQCYFLEENTYYFDRFSSRHGACVGSTSLIHSIMFDAKEIYLLGLDYALDSETGASHAHTHVTKEKQNMSTKSELKTTIDSRENLFSVRGNFKQEVYTNPLFYSSIQALYNLLPYLKDTTQKIYNLNDGAYIENSTPLKTEDIQTTTLPILDKKYIHNEIMNMFSQRSAKSLSNEDVHSLMQRLKYTKKIKSLINKYEKNISYANSDTYLYKLLGIVSDILHLNGSRETDNIVESYFSYFKYAIPIIHDMLNTKGLKNSKHHTKKLDKLFINELKYIENRYESSYEKFLKERCNN